LTCQGIHAGRTAMSECRGFLRHTSWLRVYSAAAAFLDAKLALTPHSNN
jgi:hypothetical protein